VLPDVDAFADLVLDTMQTALAPILEKVAVLQARLDHVASADLTKEIGAVRERLAVLETRPPLPGPAGQDGAPGPPGKDGADGTPGLVYRGVFLEGQCYEVGHLVTWAGATWHCNEPTLTKPGDGSKAWTLMVKKGKDGRDGKDGLVGPPGPAGKDWQQVYEDTRRR
jgi:hypothetical protein